MTFDYKKPFTTRDGMKARLLADDLKGAGPLVVAITPWDGSREFVKTYDKNGRNLLEGVQSNLINIPERKEFWMKVTIGGVSPACSSKISAEEYKTGWQTYGFLKLIYEDGKLVDQEYFKFDGDE